MTQDTKSEHGDFRGSFPRTMRQVSDWHGSDSTVQALEPHLPIVDPHHHLFGTRSDPIYYELDDLAQDVAGGHRIIGTVYVEAYEAGWRKSGPEGMRSVGEVERIVDLTRKPLQMPYGACEVAAGIVSNLDLTQGDGVTDVIEAQIAAGEGRLRGVRHRVATDDGTVGRFIKDKPRPHLLSDPAFRRGFAHLQRFGLTFDAWVYHTQLTELVALADAFPQTPVVLNHVGAPIGVAEWKPKRTEVLKQWREDLSALASRPNVHVKIGGMGMTVFGFGFEHSPKPATASVLANQWRPLIETCVEVFGATRCMFESNFPVDKQSCSYVELWNAFKLATQAFSVEERADLFFATACRTYRLPKLLAVATGG